MALPDPDRFPDLYRTPEAMRAWLDSAPTDVEREERRLACLHTALNPGWQERLGFVPGADVVEVLRR